MKYATAKSPKWHGSLTSCLGINLVFLMLFVNTAVAQDNLDTGVVRIAEPAYPREGDEHPRVLFDEAHFNSHTPTGSYRAFAQLIRNDGYQLSTNAQRLDATTLSDVDVLIVATPQAFEDSLVNWSAPEITRENWNDPAFTQQEINAVHDWVQAGGGLLSITGHAPRAGWSRALVARFGADVHDSYVYDTLNSHRTYDTRPPGSWLLFTRENGLLGEHPVTSGRDASERVHRITANGSASVSGPPGSTAILQLGDSAEEWILLDFSFWRDARGIDASGTGRAQGVVFRYGEGRVVVLTPSALFGPYLGRSDLGESRQLGLNILHWLSGLLDPQ